MIAIIIVSILMLSIATLFFVWSYQFKRGKWLMLIAGYNLLTEAERNKLDPMKIGKDSAKVCFWGGIYVLFEFAIIIFALTTFYSSTWLFIGLIILPTLIFIIYCFQHVAKTNQYFKEKLGK